MPDATTEGQPLSGARVIEVGGTVPVAAAGKVFSDYGADVVKVEPPAGAPLRRLGPFPGDVPSREAGAYHVALDTGKRSVVLDWSSASGRQVLDRLLAGADLALVHLDAEAALDLREGVRTMSPRPALVNLTEHGLDGPYAGRVEDDMSLFAWTGRMRQHALPGEQPLRYAPQVASMQWGATAGTAAAAALWARSRGGEAREVEVSAVEAMAGNVDTWFLLWEFTGAESPRQAQSKTAYPAGCYRCADGYVAFSAANPPFFNRLCEAIGRPELADDPRFASPTEKPEHFEEFLAIIEPWLRERTRHEVFTTLQSFGVMVAPVLDASEVARDAQAVARGSFVEHPLPDGGATTLAGPPFRLDGGWALRPAPRLGEHTDEVLAELGYDTTARLALFRAAVTG